MIYWIKTMFFLLFLNQSGLTSTVPLLFRECWGFNYVDYAVSTACEADLYISKFFSLSSYYFLSLLDENISWPCFVVIGGLAGT